MLLPPDAVVKLLLRLSYLIRRTQERGLRVILGNGVAGEVGCYHKALIFHHHGLENPGEMNGFLKLREPLERRPIPLEGNRVIVDPAPPGRKGDHVALPPEGDSFGKTV
ncbi:MAG: hypothetical protein ACE5IG_03310 [Dehalococcoidia bacterium]